MSAIDEIMELAQSYADSQQHTSAARNDARSALRNLIAAALADARREGAEQMRNAVAEWHQEVGLFLDESDVVVAIRAMPLPTWSQPAGAVPGEWIKWAGGECPIPDGVGFQFKFRDDSQNKGNVHYKATEWDWSDCAADADIVAYRVLP